MGGRGGVMGALLVSAPGLELSFCIKPTQKFDSEKLAQEMPKNQTRECENVQKKRSNPPPKKSVKKNTDGVSNFFQLCFYML